MSEKRAANRNKRDEIRERRRKDQNRQRIIVLCLVGAGILLIAAVLILPGLMGKQSADNIIVPTPYTLSQSSGTSMGSPDAPVKVEEYSDFQCPYCQQFATLGMPEIISKYVNTGKVYFTFTPFSFLGAESVSAAQAAYCASDQNKFWDYHEILFANLKTENGGDYADKNLKAFAGKLGLDQTSFNQCLDSGQYKQRVENDRQTGAKRGVQGTPYFFVNGKGPIDANQALTAIEEALKK